MPHYETKLVRSSPLVFNPDDWEPLGEGTYNEVYRSKRPLKLDPKSSYRGPWVLKFPKLKIFPFESLNKAEFNYLKDILGCYAHSAKEKQVFKCVSEVSEGKHMDNSLSLADAELLVSFLKRQGNEELSQKLSLEPVFDSFVGANRELRILSEIYGDKEHVPQAKIKRAAALDPELEASYAWAAPYIPGVQATDSEIAEELVNIYRKTRRIVTDAPARKNFLTLSYEDGSKSTYCVDVDYALRRTNSVLSVEGGGEVGSNDIYDLYWNFWAANSDRYPKTISTIISLLVLEERLDPSHDLDSMLTPYVVGGLRYFRKLPKDKLIPFNQVLLENLSFLEKRAVVLDCHWYQAVYRFSKSSVIFTESSYHNLLNTPTQIDDTVNGRNDWLDALVILSERDIWLTARDLRRVSILLARSGNLNQAISTLLEFYHVGIFAEPDVTDMDTADESFDVAADSSRVDVLEFGRHPQTFFGCKAEAGRGGDGYQSEVPQQHQRGHSILDWAVNAFSLRGLLY